MNQAWSGNWWRFPGLKSTELLSTSPHGSWRESFLFLLVMILHQNNKCLELFWPYRWSNAGYDSQALVSFKKYMPPPLPYFKVNICPFPLPHFASIFFGYLWSFHWPNYIVTLPRYFSFRLPHLNIPTGSPSDELDKNSQRTWLSENFSHWNGLRWIFHMHSEFSRPAMCNNAIMIISSQM